MCLDIVSTWKRSRLGLVSDTRGSRISLVLDSLANVSVSSRSRELRSRSWSRRDGPKTFWVETEIKNETWAPETETRPRRLPNCPRRDWYETLECPRRDRDETFFWSRLYRDTWLIYAWYMHFTLCPQKRIPQTRMRKTSKQTILD